MSLTDAICGPFDFFKGFRWSGIVLYEQLSLSIKTNCWSKRMTRWLNNSCWNWTSWSSHYNSMDNVDIMIFVFEVWQNWKCCPEKVQSGLKTWQRQGVKPGPIHWVANILLVYLQWTRKSFLKSSIKMKKEAKKNQIALYNQFPVSMDITCTSPFWCLVFSQLFFKHVNITWQFYEAIHRHLQRLTQCGPMINWPELLIFWQCFHSVSSIVVQTKALYIREWNNHLDEWHSLLENNFVF